MIELRQAMESFGASKAEIDKAVSQEQKKNAELDPGFVVHYENWDAYQAFRRMDTQWRIHGFSGRALGIDYNALIPVLNMFHSESCADVFDQVRLIERGFLNEVNS